MQTNIHSYNLIEFGIKNYGFEDKKNYICYSF